jgi:predicted HicB family RNase H-like nuclease
MKFTNDNNKRLFSWITPNLHGEAKASAAIKGMKLQDWVAEAVQEKVEREKVNGYENRR